MLTLPSFPCRAGGVCAFISNNRFSQAVKNTFPSVNNTLDDVQTYVASIPQVCVVPLPCLRGKGPGRRSSSTSPLGKGNRGAGSRERSPPSLTPHLCPYSKLILSSTRAMFHLTTPTTASRVRVCDGRGWSIPLALWRAAPGLGVLEQQGCCVGLPFCPVGGSRPCGPLGWLLRGCIKGLGLEALPSSSSAPVAAFPNSDSSLGRVMQVVGG